MKKFKLNILFYLAATLLFIASTISAICGAPSGTTLGLGSLCLVLGLLHDEKTKGKKDNKDKEDNE